MSTPVAYLDLLTESERKRFKEALESYSNMMSAPRLRWLERPRTRAQKRRLKAERAGWSDELRGRRRKGEELFEFELLAKLLLETLPLRARLARIREIAKRTGEVVGVPDIAYVLGISEITLKRRTGESEKYFLGAGWKQRRAPGGFTWVACANDLKIFKLPAPQRRRKR